LEFDLEIIENKILQLTMKALEYKKRKELESSKGMLMMRVNYEKKREQHMN